MNIHIEIVNYNCKPDRIDVCVHVPAIGWVVFQSSEGSLAVGKTGLWLADDDEVDGCGRQAAFDDLNKEVKAKFLDAAQAEFDGYLERHNDRN